MRNQSRRQEMLHHINVVSFAVDDIKLFLNTHPDNQEALITIRNTAVSAMKL